MSIKLIALDIDGTLMPPGADYNAVPNPSMTEVIRDLMLAGISVVLATGRMYPGTIPIARHLGINNSLICQQGASTHALDGEVLHRVCLDQDIALELAKFATAGNWPYAWFDAERYLVSRPNPASLHFAELSGVNVEHHPQPELSGVIATGVDIISTHADSTRIYADITKRYGDRATVLDFPSVTAIHAPQASKGKALQQLAAKLGTEQTDVLAIGDSVNDVSMLEWAGHGATPEHCDHYARAAADQILSGKNVDGVVKLLQIVLADTLS